MTLIECGLFEEEPDVATQEEGRWEAGGRGHGKQTIKCYNDNCMDGVRNVSIWERRIHILITIGIQKACRCSIIDSHLSVFGESKNYIIQ